MDNDATPKVCKDAIRAAAPRQAEVIRFDHVSDLVKASGQGKLFDWMNAELKGLPDAAPGHATNQVTAAQAGPHETGNKTGETQVH